MTFFLITSCALAAFVALILWRSATRAHPTAQSDPDLSIYKAQLAEIDRDLARGMINDSEADDLRIEVKRRVLAADSAAQAQNRLGGRAPLALGVAVIATLGIAFATYWQLGAPGYADLPLETRRAMLDQAAAQRPSQAAAQAEFARVAPPPNVSEEHKALVAELRRTMQERPDDTRGLTLLARNEAALGNFDAALAVQAQLVTLKGGTPTADDLLDQAELMVLATGGYVSPEAEEVLVRAGAIDPTHPLVRFYLGLMLEQTGRYDRAFSMWRAVLEDDPGPSPWSDSIRAQIIPLAERAGVARYTPPPIPTRGPTAEDMAAAAEMSTEDRMAMIEGMVSGLAERLGEGGGPPQDWARLVTALGVLGRQDDAAQILLEARTLFSGDASAMAVLDQAAERAGITP